MATQTITILKVGGAAGKSVFDTFARFKTERTIRRKPAMTGSTHWTPHCRRRMDAFAESLRSHRSEAPIIFYVEYVDMWTGPVGPAFLPSWDKRAIELYADQYDLACYALPDRDRLKRDMGNAFRRRDIRERSAAGQESRWALTILQEALFAWKELVDDAVLVWLRRAFAPNISDAEITESLNRIPMWCRGRTKGS